MAYEIQLSKQFFADFANVPKQVQNAYIKQAHSVLRSSAENYNAIKKLKGAKKLWRYRISDDYRIIYEAEDNHVTLLMIGNRKDVYERLRYNPDKETFRTDIIGKMPDLLDPEPSPEMIGKSILLTINEKPTEDIVDRPLPFELTQQLLFSWGIPKEFHALLIECKTDEALLRVDVPSDIVDRILNIIYPPTIVETVNKPKYVLENPEDLEKLVTDKKELSSFILALDKTQREYVARFTQRDTGPWLLKGGPGSGKSTIALYCIRSLLFSRLPYAQAQRTLFTTYTNSLTFSSRKLLESLMETKLPHSVHIRTMNSLAAFHADPRGDGLQIVEADKEKQIMGEVINGLRAHRKIASFTSGDSEFVREEIEWVILGNSLKNEEDYIRADRTGRGRRLGKNQQSDLWRIYEAYVSELKSRHLITHDQVVIKANERVKLISDDKKYDYVFIDEAQDFKPTGISFCVGLARNPKNVFLTMDPNQAIYGRGIKWKSVHEALRFTKGTSDELKVNYRSTKEIMNAIKQIAENIDDRDTETLVLNTAFSGEPPAVCRYDSADDEIKVISKFILTSLKKLNMGLGCVAILCRNNKDAEGIAEKLPINLKSRFMSTKQVDIDYNGVKVMTIHAAKGLEFPVVIVARVNKNSLPSKAVGGQDENEHIQSEMKLFFVACSRAMKVLQVVTNRHNASPFVGYLTDRCWSID